MLLKESLIMRNSVINCSRVSLNKVYDDWKCKFVYQVVMIHDSKSDSYPKMGGKNI